MDTKASRLALGCIVIGMAGAISAIVGQGSANLAAARSTAPQNASDLCTIAAGFAADGQAGVAADLRRAVGCPAGR